ncbi:MAG: crotonase/enoyl-CoA hydratase family protein [Actinobacteria bacterium]|jgi:enoyl-CoA hydratase|nr:crotonase/enoyl-CoA hydratase family protein [Actinomycetota bacterium]MBT3746313.1 crotonase/enoyl-CoA hydratase family protein [Actinomycetota bacterium]MBT3969253.1 crotonase/enoyl-CoA hydratase family protein [Actinomycetota bacterium]MBT4010637.1 crotonase/enoyl-CoA hydratase family protein [Actinomycetota bacterium]MBT4302329.1 crotonase/enoyl-CoA hydratase family protein [Actinomycetota bacterium]
MSENTAVLTEKRGRVLLITLNRPEAMNAINGDLANGLWDAVQILNDDPDLTAGVLTGNGRGFCAGMDLKAFLRGENIGPFMEFVKEGAQKPLIGAIEGFALAGGLELALSCDLLVASEGAKMGIPEVGVGLFAAAGGVLRLSSRVGHGKAMEMAITADPILAEEALQFGLIARMTEKGGAVEGALKLAERVAQNAPLAVAASKKLVQAASSGASEEELWALNTEMQMKVFVSNDSKEGPKAFAEKRPPEWTGT